MSASDDMSGPGYLSKDNPHVALPVGPTTFEYPGGIKLAISCSNDHKVSAYLFGANGKIVSKIEDHDLSQRPFLIKHPIHMSAFDPRRVDSLRSTIRIPDADEFKGVAKGMISLNEPGLVSYLHADDEPIANPWPENSIVKPAPPVVPTVQLSAGQHSVANKKSGHNQDRKGVFSVPAMEWSLATAFLKHLFCNVALPAVKDLKDVEVAANAKRKGKSASTLSIAVPMDDGRYVCGFAGDSPFYIVGRNKEGVFLERMFLPHTEASLMVRPLCADACDSQRTSYLLDVAKLKLDDGTHGLPSLLQVAPTRKALAEVLTDKKMYMALTCGSPYLSQRNTMPELQVLDPELEMQEGSEFLGIMIASDGICAGIENGAVQQALITIIPATGPIKLSGNEICRKAVEAARPHTRDNITATFVPAGEKAMAFVADGNGRSDIVSEAISKAISQHIGKMKEPKKAPATPQESQTNNPGDTPTRWK